MSNSRVYPAQCLDLRHRDGPLVGGESRRLEVERRERLEVVFREAHRSVDGHRRGRRDVHRLLQHWRRSLTGATTSRVATRGPRQSPGRPRGGIMSRLDCSAGAWGTMTTMRTRYHFSGVGGAGMSPLARLMRARGHAVQGSDRAFDAGKNREAADTLRAAGVELVTHDGSGITGVIDHFVFSTAVEAETPEMRAARARGLAMLARPALLAELVDTGRPGVAVSGTSGKSTITGMVAWLARESGAVAASCPARATARWPPRRASPTGPSSAITRRWG